MTFEKFSMTFEKFSMTFEKFSMTLKKNSWSFAQKGPSIFQYSAPSEYEFVSAYCIS